MENLFNNFTSDIFNLSEKVGKLIKLLVKLAVVAIVLVAIYQQFVK